MNDEERKPSSEEEAARLEGQAELLRELAEADAERRGGDRQTAEERALAAELEVEAQCLRRRAPKPGR